MSTLFKAQREQLTSTWKGLNPFVFEGQLRQGNLFIEFEPLFYKPLTLSFGFGG